MRINTRSVDFKADEKLLNYVNSKLEKITKYFDRVIESEVVMSLENSGQIRDKIVEINLKVPGNYLVVSSVNKSFEAAFDNAFESAKRKLKRYKERRRSRA